MSRIYAGTWKLTEAQVKVLARYKAGRGPGNFVTARGALLRKGLLRPRQEISEHSYVLTDDGHAALAMARAEGW